MQKSLNAYVVDCTTSVWVSSFAPKQSLFRFFNDYHHLNKATIKDAYSLPRIGKCTSSLGSAKILSTLDASIFNQLIFVEEKDWKLRPLYATPSHINTNEIQWVCLVQQQPTEKP